MKVKFVKTDAYHAITRAVGSGAGALDPIQMVLVRKCVGRTEVV